MGRRSGKRKVIGLFWVFKEFGFQRYPICMFGWRLVLEIPTLQFYEGLETIFYIAKSCNSDILSGSSICVLVRCVMMISQEALL